MTDRQFTDAAIARCYDVFHPPQQRDDFRFYLPRILAARAVLDVGCGTGALLRMARDAGHAGRLCGLDPGAAMLDQARTRPGVECTLGHLGSVAWDREFDLVVMTGHAFQVLLTDDELDAALRAIRAALTERGRFAFETRNPLARAWESWTPDRPVEAVGSDGAVLRMTHDVSLPVERDLVSFTTTFESSDWDGPRTSHSTLRFLDANPLRAAIDRVGLAIEDQFGDWDGQPCTDTSPEIVTITRT